VEKPVQKVSHQVDIEIQHCCAACCLDTKIETAPVMHQASLRRFSLALFFGGFGYQNPKVSAISSQHAPAQWQLGRTADHGVAQKMRAIFNPWQAGLAQ